MKQIKIVLIIFLLGMLSAACQNGNEKSEAVINSEKKTIEISKNQFAAAKMQMGTPEVYTFNDVVNAKGYVKASPEGIAHISVPVQGKASNIRYGVGQYVEKGSRLFDLEGEEIIQLQQEYAQNTAQFNLAGQELERLKSLASENIASKKEYQQAQSNYQYLNAVHQGLKARLEHININADEIELGKIVRHVPVFAPISGFITERNLIQGDFVEPMKRTFEIVDTRKLKLFINVFENNVADLKVGQRILFYEPDRKENTFEAELFLIGKSIDKDSKTIQCVANIDKNNDYSFVNGMYAECAIITTAFESKAVPSEAVMKDGHNHFLLVKTGESSDNLQFSKVNVTIGRQEINYTEILTEGLADVLMTGAYNLVLSQ